MTPLQTSVAMIQYDSYDFRLRYSGFELNTNTGSKDDRIDQTISSDKPDNPQVQLNSAIESQAINSTTESDFKICIIATKDALEFYTMWAACQYMATELEDLQI